MGSMLVHGGLSPAGAGLQPEDRRCHAFTAVSDGFPVEAFGYTRICLDAAALQFVRIVGLQLVFLDAKNAGDVGRR